MLSFEDKASFTCEKRSSPRTSSAPALWISAARSPRHTEKQLLEFRDPSSAWQVQYGTCQTSCPLTCQCWQVSFPQIKSYLALSKDVKVCSTHHEHLFKIFNINTVVVGTCFEICLLATSELFTVNHIWIEMKELHLTSERKIHTTCVYKATHYRWLLWW